MDLEEGIARRCFGRALHDETGGKLGADGKRMLIGLRGFERE